VFRPSGSQSQPLADGRYVMFSMRRMQNGGIAGLHIDITQMKVTEDQLRQSRDNLNRAQRLAKIGRFNRAFRTGEVIGSEEFYRICGFDAQLPAPTTLVPFISPIAASPLSFCHMMSERPSCLNSPSPMTCPLRFSPAPSPRVHRVSLSTAGVSARSV